MSRECPVCTYVPRNLVFSMSYKIPNDWPLPNRIDWYICGRCGMLYGDGDFDQHMLDEYYSEYYGYGVNNPDNIARLQIDAEWITQNFIDGDCIVDFGGRGDDGQSVIQNILERDGFHNVHCVGVGDELPKNAKLIYASHVLEHIYDLPRTIKKIKDSLAYDGILIVDVPDSTGLLLDWKMPILDFNTKHINHFTLRNLLDLGYHQGLESIHLHRYLLEGAPAFHVYFCNLDMASQSAIHITKENAKRLERIKELIKEPVNIWGLSDIVWHVLASIDLEILDYIDNDPAYRGKKYNGKYVQEMPTNSAPIVILAQGQRQRLIENIRKMGILNEIIEI